MIMGNFVGDLNLKKHEDYINVFDALSHPVRIKIIGILAEGRQYVSELARLVNISRPLLYMHLKKLETARLVTSAMEISESGKAMKYYALEDFELQIPKELLNELSQNIIIETPSKDSDSSGMGKEGLCLNEKECKNYGLFHYACLSAYQRVRGQQQRPEHCIL